MDHKVAVIGGTGFLGSHIVHQLVEAGYTPVVVARHPQKAAEVLPGLALEVRQADLMDLAGLEAALAGCAYALAVAAIVCDIYTSASPGELVAAAERTNVEGTLNVLRAARANRIRRVVVTGSAATRYIPGGALADEDAVPPDPDTLDDPYVRSKLLAERAVMAYARETGIDYAYILPGGLLGPMDYGPSVFGKAFASDASVARPAGIEGALPIVDVRDAARAHVAALERATPGRSYLAVADTIRCRDFDAIVARVTGLPAPKFYMPAAAALSMAAAFELKARLTKQPPRVTQIEVRHIIQGQKFDCSRLRDELGISFVPLAQTVSETYAWFCEHGFIRRKEVAHA
jgi:dihydroflavonol-4-reductase